jgi:hypothetical protein
VIGANRHLTTPWLVAYGQRELIDYLFALTSIKRESRGARLAVGTSSPSPACASLRGTLRAPGRITSAHSMAGDAFIPSGYSPIKHRQPNMLDDPWLNSPRITKTGQEPPPAAEQFLDHHAACVRTKPIE